MRPSRVKPTRRFAEQARLARVRVRAALAAQLVRDLRDLAALVACSDQLVRGRHPRAITTGNRCGTVLRPARNLIKGHLTGMAVVQADDHHAEVQEIGYDRE